MRWPWTDECTSRQWPCGLRTQILQYIAEGEQETAAPVAHACACLSSELGIVVSVRPCAWLCQRAASGRRCLLVCAILPVLLASRQEARSDTATSHIASSPSAPIRWRPSDVPGPAPRPICDHGRSPHEHPGRPAHTSAVHTSHLPRLARGSASDPAHCPGATLPCAPDSSIPEPLTRTLAHSGHPHHVVTAFASRHPVHLPTALLGGGWVTQS
jgi:hypothetical protein